MLDFNDCTFLIPYMKDSNDRSFNLHIILRYLNNIMKTNIIIVEQNKKHYTTNEFNLYNNLNIQHLIYENSGNFHKTKLYNIGLSKINTEITVCLDSDVMIPKEQLLQAKNCLLNGMDYVFPFSENYIEISKILTKSRNDFLASFNFGQYLLNVKEYQKTYDTVSSKERHPGLIRGCPPGGCLFVKTKVYVSIGMENEEFFGYAPEDAERKHRLNIFGYKTQTIPGHLYHLDHSIVHRRVSNNVGRYLFEKLKSFDPQQLKKYYDNLNYKQKYNL
jgi:hypothetical protein